MKKLKKRVYCKCGASVKLNLLAINNALDVNCPACGKKIIEETPNLVNYIDEMKEVKDDMAYSGQPFKTLANYAYQKKYGDKYNPLEKHNVLID